MITEQGGLIAWFARNPVAANLLMLIILTVGIVSGLNLRREAFPSFEPDSVTVTVPFNSGSAALAEEIAIKIEEAITSVAGIKTTTSTSDASGVTTTIVRKSGTDLNKLVNEVKAAVDTIPTLPARAERPVIQEQQWENDALWVQVYGDAGQATLQRTAQQLREALLASNSISRVNLVGNRIPEISIEVSESELQAYDLTLAEVSDVVARESFSEVGGALRSEDVNIGITADQRRFEEQEFADIVLRGDATGGQLRLGDIADVVDGYDAMSAVWMRFQQQPAIALQIVTGGGDDIVRSVAEAKSIVEDWRQSTRLPAGVSVEAWIDASQTIASRLRDMLKNGLGGILLVVGVLAIFLNLRVAFWVAMGLPICFAGAAVFMGQSILDISLSELSTFGFIVAMGIIVDDAIVVGENIYSSRVKYGESVESTIRGVQQVSVPTIFGALTTIAAFGSLVLVDGSFGRIFAVFAIIVAVSLVFSIIESKLILPAHLAHLPVSRSADAKPGPLERLRGRIDEALSRFRTQTYLPFLRWLLRHRLVAVAAFVALMAGAYGLVSSGAVRTVFFPSIPSQTVSLDVTAQADASFGIVERSLARIEATVGDLNDQYSAATGGGPGPIVHMQTRMIDDLTGRVTIGLSADSSQAIDLEQLVREWREAIGTPEGIESIRIDANEGAPEELQIELLASNAGELAAANGVLMAALEHNPAVQAASSNYARGRAQVRLELNAEGRMLGLSAQDLAEQLQQAFFGFETQRIQRGKDELRVRVRYPESERRDISDLWQMRVRTPGGAVVPLESVSTPVTEYPVPAIYRYNGNRSVTVTADIDETIAPPSAIVQQLEQTTFRELSAQYPGLRIVLGGQAEEMGIILTSLMKSAGFALLMIYALIAIPLRSYSQPLLIMMAIPFGLVGAIAGHFILGLPISLLSMFGILALSGVMVNDSLLLISRFNEHRKAGIEMTEALLTACGDRLRAVFLTSVTTFIGLLPLLSSTSIQGQYLKPAAASLAYGILFGSAITLVMIPVLVHTVQVGPRPDTAADDDSRAPAAAALSPIKSKA